MQTPRATVQPTTLLGKAHALLSGLGPAWLIQAFKFLAVGALNTLVDAGLYFALTRWLGLAILPTLAKAISYGIGVLNSFYWNRSWTFRSKGKALSKFTLFVMANLIALALNAGLMHIGLVIWQLPELAALVLATGSTLVWNFTISKFFIFNR
jgi:putative flippase GtrA